MLEETTPLGIEMFHDRIKVINKKDFGLVCNNSSV